MGGAAADFAQPPGEPESGHPVAFAMLRRGFRDLGFDDARLCNKTKVGHAIIEASNKGL